MNSRGAITKTIVIVLLIPSKAYLRGDVDLI